MNKETKNCATKLQAKNACDHQSNTAIKDSTPVINAYLDNAPLVEAPPIEAPKNTDYLNFAKQNDLDVSKRSLEAWSTIELLTFAKKTGFYDFEQLTRNGLIQMLANNLSDKVIATEHARIMNASTIKTLFALI